MVMIAGRREIDCLAYDLYGLTASNIAMIDKVIERRFHDKDGSRSIPRVHAAI